MIQFFNTLSGKKEAFTPIHAGEVKLYTCGPTVYDYPHIGNYRAYVFEDLLKRFLIFQGYKVTHVMNITDVDDKTIKGANARGVSLAEYTREYIDAFFEDIKTLHISPADRYPRATEHIPEMVNLIKGLVQKGYAYKKDGSYYFSIAKFPAYGRLSKIDMDGLKPGQRVEADEYEKENVHDFALWKAAKEGEPSWPSELGAGRPGWHIECSAMSAKYLGETFDIHCGGVDNIFPHHENEIAQSEALSGKKFVNYWLHCHHLIRDGEKMSKSKGNTITLREVLKVKNNPAAVRLLLLSTHYRKTLNFTFEALGQAETALQRINDFAGEVKSGQFSEGTTQAVGRLVREAEKSFAAGLSDDLNISVAMTAVFNLVKKANILISRGKVRKGDAEQLSAFMDSVNTVLHVITPTRLIHMTEPVGVSDAVPEVEIAPPAQFTEVQTRPTAEQQEKIKLWEKRRAEKNYQLADKIRKDLKEQGILLESTKEGFRVRILPPKKKKE